jgi:hypothetical protein
MSKENIIYNSFRLNMKNFSEILPKAEFKIKLGVSK